MVGFHSHHWLRKDLSFWYEVGVMKMGEVNRFLAYSLRLCVLARDILQRGAVEDEVINGGPDFFVNGFKRPH